MYVLKSKSRDLADLVDVGMSKDKRFRGLGIDRL